jgi:hypothetical protein
MKRSFTEMSPDDLIDINDDITNLEYGLQQVANKQYDDNRIILYKLRLIEFILVVKIFIIWTLVVKAYK